MREQPTNFSKPVSFKDPHVPCEFLFCERLSKFLMSCRKRNSIQKYHFWSRIKIFPSLILALQNRGFQNTCENSDEDLFSQLKSNILQKALLKTAEGASNSILEKTTTSTAFLSSLTLKSNAKEFYLISQEGGLNLITSLRPFF